MVQSARPCDDAMAPRPRPEAKREARVGLLLFVILLTCYTYTFPRWADWNQNSRLNLVMAIVDRGVLHIDDYYQGHTQTGDYAEFGGHVYSDKAPGTAFLAVPIYAALRAVTGGQAFHWLVHRLQASRALGETLVAGGTGVLPEKVHAALALAVVTFGVVSVPSALLGALLYRFSPAVVPGATQGARVAAVLLYGLATIAYPYSGALYGHQVVAAALFAAFALAHGVVCGRGGAPALLAIGLLLGWAVITEYSAPLIAVAVAVYLALRLPRRGRLAWAAVGAMVPALLWMAYNSAIYRRPIVFGYRYTTLFQDEHAVGFLSLTRPSLEALWGITFGSYRGLFFLSPVLLLALPGLAAMARSGPARAEALVCAWAFLSFVLFNGSTVMWDGGFAVGPRYLVPMLPFLVPPFLVTMHRLGRRRAGGVLVALLAAWSFLAVWAESLGGQAFPDRTANPLFRYSLVRLWQGDVARNVGMLLGLNGLASLIPLVLIVTLLLTALRLAGRQREAGAADGVAVAPGMRAVGALHEPD